MISSIYIRIIIVVCLLIICKNIYFGSINKIIENNVCEEEDQSIHNSYSTIESFKSCDFKHGVLNDKQLSDLSDLLLKLMNWFNTNGISFFGHSGTALGAMRSGGLMPFDDDIDLGFIKSDDIINKIESYKNEKYYFQPRWFGYKFKNKHSKVFIDIMIFSLDETDSKYKMLGWDWNYINKSELYPLKLHTYNEIDIPFPNKCIEYLNRTYTNWDTTIKVNCGHEREIGNSEKCIYDTMNIPSEFNVNDYDQKYVCYTKF